MTTSAQTAQQIKELLKPGKDEKSDAARLDELRRLFGQLLQQGEFTLGGVNTGNITSSSVGVTQKWQAFLLKSFQTMVSQLQHAIEKDGRKSAVRTLFGVVAACPVNGKLPHLNVTLLEYWLNSLSKVKDLDDKALRTMIQGEFLQTYRDVQYYAWVAIANIARELYHNTNRQKGQNEQLFQLLLMIPIPTNQNNLNTGVYIFPPLKETLVDPDVEEEEEEESDPENEEELDSNNTDESSESEEEEESASKSRKRKRTTQTKARTFAFEQLKAHRKALSIAWLAMLKLDLPTVALKQALLVLPQVLSQVPEPLRFADFFMQAFNNKGVLPILALDGLFILMMQHNLEYPAFYSSLYSLIQPSLLYVKFRTRFFDLLTKCLMHNQMLPAHLVAAFCKRLLRVSLSAPPPSILYCLALTGNLLRKHPECACLIHRTTAMNDVFDAETNDPTKARALESSLWELHVLSHHYYPAVVTMAKSIGTETATTQMYHLPDFLAHTYKSLFDQERKQSRKKVALTFQAPGSLFSEHDILTNIVSLPTETSAQSAN